MRWVRERSWWNSDWKNNGDKFDGSWGESRREWLKWRQGKRFEFDENQLVLKKQNKLKNVRRVDLQAGWSSDSKVMLLCIVCIIEMIIREQLKLEGLSEVTWFSPDQGRSHLPGFPRTVWSCFEPLQGWRVHTLSWQLVPIFDYSDRKSVV